MSNHYKPPEELGKKQLKLVIMSVMAVIMLICIILLTIAIVDHDLFLAICHKVIRIVYAIGLWIVLYLQLFLSVLQWLWDKIF